MNQPLWNLTGPQIPATLGAFLEETGPASCPIVREMALPSYPERALSIATLGSEAICAVRLTVSEGGMLRGALVALPGCPPELLVPACSFPPEPDHYWLLATSISPADPSKWRVLSSGSFFSGPRIAQLPGDPTKDVAYRTCSGGELTPELVAELVPDTETPLRDAGVFREWLSSDCLSIVACSEQGGLGMAAVSLRPRPAVCYLYCKPVARGRGLALSLLRRLSTELLLRGYPPAYAMTEGNLEPLYTRAGFEQHRGWRLWGPCP